MFIASGGDTHFRKSSYLSAGGDVSIDVAGRLDLHGRIRGNDVVEIRADRYRPYSSSDLSGNLACTIEGERVRESRAAVEGCVVLP